ncbi:hypothetical protein BC828DRAFT_375808 [Blastocladiella britannica]|nr:hypothetical protein BC828DRAFT_375808 [Blastocladiella britannica]
MVNPTTALRMLTDYVTLGQGDVVVQNAGNSAVGQYVGQISRARGYTCVSVVRDRPDFDATAVLLKSQGAAHVVRPADLAALVAAHPEWKVRLAFNAVGPAPEIISVLSPGAIFVTYGAMTSDPLAINPGLFIIKDLTLKGFWLSQWGKTAPAGAYRAMIDELIAMYGTGALQTPEFAEIVVAAENPDHKAIVDGIAAAGASFLGRKQLIVFQ